MRLEVEFVKQEIAARDVTQVKRSKLSISMATLGFSSYRQTIDISFAGFTKHRIHPEAYGLAIVVKFSQVEDDRTYLIISPILCA